MAVGPPTMTPPIFWLACWAQRGSSLDDHRCTCTGIEHIHQLAVVDCIEMAITITVTTPRQDGVDTSGDGCMKGKNTDVQGLELVASSGLLARYEEELEGSIETHAAADDAQKEEAPNGATQPEEVAKGKEAVGMDLTPRGDIILCPERSATLDQIATDVLLEEAQAKAAADAVREKARAKAAFAAVASSSASSSTKRAHTTKRSKINTSSSGLKSSGESSWFWDKFVLPEEEIKPVQTEETEDESVSGSEDEYEPQDDHSDVHIPASEANNATYAVESSEAQDLAESKPAKSKIIPPSRVGRFRSFLSPSQKKNKKAKGGSRPAQGNFLAVATRPAPSPVKKQSPGPLGKLFTCGRADSLDGYSCASDSTANWVPKLKWCNSCAIHCCVIYTD